MEFFDYGIDDFIPDEINGTQCIDIHHINGRGKGKNVIENLMGLSRENHNKAHRHEYSKEYLTEVHLKFMELYGQRKTN